MHAPNWLKNAVLYNVYPQTFCDSNGDGIGDIEPHQRINTVSEQMDRVVVDLLLVDGQSTVADDVETGAVEVEIIVDIDDAERTVALNL